MAGISLDYMPEIYQSVSEPFVIEEDSPKKKPIIVGRPVEESAPELPEVSEVVSAEPVEEPAVEEPPREPPQEEIEEEKPRSIKKPKSKRKPPEKPAERPTEPTEKARHIETEKKTEKRHIEKASAPSTFNETMWQIAAIAGLGLLALIVIRRLRL